MAFIDLGPDEDQVPGLTGLMRFRPETAGPISALSEVLMRGESTLTRGERELIAAYVSGRNDCEFCRDAHSAFSAAQIEGGMPTVLQVHRDPTLAPISPKLRALLKIAEATREDGRKVTIELVEAARAEGATDLEIHDTVLITAAFCMQNRYVDGLGTLAAQDPGFYGAIAEVIVEYGYVM